MEELKNQQKQEDTMFYNEVTDETIKPFNQEKESLNKDQITPCIQTESETAWTLPVTATLEATEEKTERFRISARNIFLTYSKVPETLTHKEVINQLKEKQRLAPFEFLIAKQAHSDNVSFHFHVVLRGLRKFNIKDETKLDLLYQGKTYHGNYQPGRCLSDMVRYVCKHGDYKTDMVNVHEGAYLSNASYFMKRENDVGYPKAALEHIANYPDKALPSMSTASIHNHYNVKKKLKASEMSSDMETPFTLNDFNPIPSTITQWLNQHRDLTLIMVGPTGAGKTVFCKALATYLGYPSLMLKNKEDFKYLGEHHKFLIYDDFKFHKLAETEILALLDAKNSAGIEVKYGAILKPPHMLQIATINVKDLNKMGKLLDDERMSRRVVIYKVKNDFLDRKTTNITQNNIQQNIQVNNTINLQVNNAATQDDKLVSAKTRKTQKKRLAYNKKVMAAVKRTKE